MKTLTRAVMCGALTVLCLNTQLSIADSCNRQPGASSLDPNAAAIKGGWYDQYMARERISDASSSSAPSKTHVDSWGKKFLQLPYPPRYRKTQQTKDDHDVWEVLSGRYKQLQYFCPMLEIAYIEYKRYNLDVTKINAACDSLRAATQIKAWKDYWERTTRVRSHADKELKQIIGTVGIEVDSLFEPLVAIKKMEYDHWASMHPQEAMAIVLKRRVAEAERRAETAEQAAKEAKISAGAAAARAAEAEFRSQDAIQRLQDVGL